MTLSNIAKLSKRQMLGALGLAGFIGITTPSARAYAGPPAPTPAPAIVIPAQGGGLPDKIVRRNPRTGKLSTLSATVTENSLGGIKVERKGKESSYESSEILSIDWGMAPASFKDGKVFAGRKDFENAVARFRMAATHTDTREVVQADARLRAADALLGWGASDVNRYAECIAEVDRYLADFPSDRRVPHGRWVKARAAQLSGDASTAAAGFRSLYEAGVSQSAAGYDRTLCMDAGLLAAHAFLAQATPDTGAARELFASLDVAYGQAATAEELSPEQRNHLVAGQGRAAVGEGFCLLASGDADKAERFFQGRLSGANENPAQRFAILFGLGRALLDQGKYREAQIELAKVSALDHTSRDRQAAALLGLAQAALKMGAADAQTSAKRWLNQISSAFSDTPAALGASQTLEKL